MRENKNINQLIGTMRREVRTVAYNVSKKKNNWVSVTQSI